MGETYDLLDDLRDHVWDEASQPLVSDVRIGLGYTAVALDDGGAGVAYTFKDDLAAGCPALRWEAEVVILPFGLRMVYGVACGQSSRERSGT